MKRAALFLLLASIAMPALADHQITDWRLIATQPDRIKLRRWERAWREALAQVQADPAGRAAVASDPAMVDPFSAIDDPAPPAGAYRCRLIKLGGRAGTPAYVAGTWGMCRIEPEGELTHLVRLDGAERPSGRFYLDAARRGVFLGTMSFGEERRPGGYGRAAGRDMAGMIERIGPARWRVIIPYPPFEATMYLLELVPAS